MCHPRGHSTVSVSELAKLAIQAGPSLEIKFWDVVVFLRTVPGSMKPV
jgi:hypothetical protein